MKKILFLFFSFCIVFGNDDQERLKRITKRVYFDIEIDRRKIGRIVIGLFGDTVPITVLNFATLSARSAPQGFKGSKFHRIERDFMIQGGDFDGLGGRSIYGSGKLEEENFHIHHFGAGTVSMANTGSQFFICTAPTPWLDGKHVVFGQVLEGMNVVKIIENIPVFHRDRPTREILIADSGVLTSDPLAKDL